MGGRVGDERGDQGDQHHPVALEIAARDERADAQNGDCDEAGKEESEPNDAMDDRLPTHAERPPGRQCSAELLLEGKEETRRQGERGEPQSQDRLELLLAADRFLADAEEGECCAPRDQQREPDRQCALGQRRARRKGAAVVGHEAVMVAAEVQGAPYGRGCSTSRASGRRGVAAMTRPVDLRVA